MVQVLFLAAALLYPDAPPDTSHVRTDLQALYDEISDATLQFASESDIDLFHDVLFTPDWTFIDAQGTVLSWPQVRAVAIQALSVAPPGRDYSADPEARRRAGRCHRHRQHDRREVQR